MSVALTSPATPNATQQELRVMVVDDSVVIRGMISRWVDSEPDMIVASSLTRRNAEISFKALSLGASDYIPKPESTREPAAAETFRHDLIQKIRHLGAKVRRAVPASSSPPLAPTLDRPRELSARPPLAPVAHPQLLRRAFSTQPPRALLIGSST